MENHNDFNLERMNDALYVAQENENSSELIDIAFNIMAETTNRHLSWDESNFGDITKGQVLGAIIDDMSNQILKSE